MSESSEAERHHRDAIVVVDHDHRPIGPDLPLMLAGGVTAKVFQVTCDVDPEAGFQASRDRCEGWLRLAVRDMADALAQIDRHADLCTLATTVEDVRRAKAENRIAILLGAEGARWLESSLEPLRLFHRLGLRELQLTWAFPNALVPDGNLSDFGKSVVAECGRLGIVVDVTHIPRPAFDQVIALATKPVIVSHGAAASVTTDLDDHQLRDLAATGGLLGIHFYHCCPRQGLRMTIEALPEVLHVAECQTKQSNASINGGLRCYGTASESVQSIASAGSPR